MIREIRDEKEIYTGKSGLKKGVLHSTPARQRPDQYPYFRAVRQSVFGRCHSLNEIAVVLSFILISVKSLLLNTFSTRISWSRRLILHYNLELRLDLEQPFPADRKISTQFAPRHSADPDDKSECLEYCLHYAKAENLMRMKIGLFPALVRLDDKVLLSSYLLSLSSTSSLSPSQTLDPRLQIFIEFLKLPWDRPR